MENQGLTLPHCSGSTSFLWSLKHGVLDIRATECHENLLTQQALSMPHRIDPVWGVGKICLGWQYKGKSCLWSKDHLTVQNVQKGFLPAQG